MAVCDLELEGGASAHVYLSWLHPEKTATVTVVGRERMLAYEGRFEKRRLTLYDYTLDRSTPADTGAAPIVPISGFAGRPVEVPAGDEPLTLAAAHFVDCIRTRCGAAHQRRPLPPRGGDARACRPVPPPAAARPGLRANVTLGRQASLMLRSSEWPNRRPRASTTSSPASAWPTPATRIASRAAAPSSTTSTSTFEGNEHDHAGRRRQARTSPCSLRELVLYFLRLGTFGFGGPIALVGYMQRDLVETRRWISKQDYGEGLALAQLAPGPLAAQLAIYLGWVRGGSLGATLVAVAFVLPSFLMVLALSALYLRYGGLPWMQGAFYGIGAAVIAIIARSAYKLVADHARHATACSGRSSLVSARRHRVDRVGDRLAVRARAASSALVACRLPPAAATAALAGRRARGSSPGCTGRPRRTCSGRSCWYFAEAGAFVFGSGLAIVPFLHGGVVNEFDWLTRAAVPRRGRGRDDHARAGRHHGRVHRLSGRRPARRDRRRVGVFLPCYLFVIIPAAVLPALRRRPARQGVRRRRHGGGDRRDRRRRVRARPARDLRRPDGADLPGDARRVDEAKRRPRAAVIVAAGVLGVVLSSLGFAA